jgi:hypothetical protein
VEAIEGVISILIEIMKVVNNKNKSTTIRYLFPPSPKGRGFFYRKSKR